MVSNKKIVIYKDNRIENTKFNPESYYVSIILYKNYDSSDYINIEREKNIHQVQRQKVSPEFIEYSFFDGIQRNRVNHGDDLTPTMINFIRRVRNDVNLAFPINEDIQRWYDLYGKFEFPWGTITKDDLEKSDATLFNIASKANYFKIDINN